MRQSSSAEDHKLVSSFEAIKRTLLRSEYRDRLDKPLAYWALPNDRRLPLAFLNRSVGDLLSTPFKELTATRGIGQKKISTLVRLLHRASSEHPPAVPFGIKELADELSQERQANQAEEMDVNATFDPALVSEATWESWCGTVRRFHLEQESLGRLAPSLQALPTVIWQTTLGAYCRRPLNEIRNLRTHGEKRVRVVLEVFHTIHHLLHASESDAHLSLQVVPQFVPRIEQFILHAARQGNSVSRDDLTSHVVEPMLRQVRVDCGADIHKLAQQRLGVGSETRTVRDLSTELGVTRARVYQLLEDCTKVMAIRWPEGKTRYEQLAPLIGGEASPLYQGAKQLFFAVKLESAPAGSAGEPPA